MSDQPVRVSDLSSVRSRVSWGAILGGSVIAFATYFLLSLLGAAVGLSVVHRVEGDSLGTGAAIWAIVAGLISLFLGGMAASRLTAGETKAEATLYGVLVWGVVMASTVYLAVNGVRAGMAGVYGAATVTAQAANNPNAPTWEELARRAGVPEERITDFRKSVAQAPDDARRNMNDPEVRREAREDAAKAAWYSVVGALLSAFAAVGGALAGSGPEFRLTQVLLRRNGVAVGRATVVSTK